MFCNPSETNRTSSDHAKPFKLNQRAEETGAEPVQNRCQPETLWSVFSLLHIGHLYLHLASFEQKPSEFLFSVSGETVKPVQAVTSRQMTVTGVGLTCFGLNFSPEFNESILLHVPARLFVLSYRFSRVSSRWVSRSAVNTVPLTLRRQVSGDRCLSARYRRKNSEKKNVFRSLTLVWDSGVRCRYRVRRFKRQQTGGRFWTRDGDSATRTRKLATEQVAESVVGWLHLISHDSLRHREPLLFVYWQSFYLWAANEKKTAVKLQRN